jgi:hypothetical protein
MYTVYPSGSRKDYFLFLLFEEEASRKRKLARESQVMLVVCVCGEQGTMEAVSVSIVYICMGIISVFLLEFLAIAHKYFHLSQYLCQQIQKLNCFLLSSWPLLCSYCWLGEWHSSCLSPIYLC